MFRKARFSVSAVRHALRVVVGHPIFGESIFASRRGAENWLILVVTSNSGGLKVERGVAS